MVVHIDVMEENLTVWKDGHHILLSKRSWLQCDLIGKLTKICMKILDDVNLKMLS